MNPPTRSTPGHRSPITLAFLFYLVTAGGIISACLRSLSGEAAVTGPALGLMMGIGAGIGLFNGLLLGLFLFHRLLVAILAGGVGIVVGAVAGALALVDSDRFFEMELIAFTGCWLMILVMSIAAWYQPEQRS